MAEGRRLSEEEKKRLAFEKMMARVNKPISKADLNVIEPGASLSRSSVQQENLGSGLAMARTTGQLASAVKDLRTAKDVSKASKAAKTASSFKVDGSNVGDIASKTLSIAGIGGEGDTSTLGGAASGAAGAMSTAASFGLVDPTSQAVAGVIGGTMGALGAGSARKAAAAAAKAKAEAQHATNLGKIEEEKDAKIQGAFSRLSQAFASNLRGKKKVTL